MGQFENRFLSGSVSGMVSAWPKRSKKQPSRDGFQMPAILVQFAKPYEQASIVQYCIRLVASATAVGEGGDPN